MGRVPVDWWWGLFARDWQNLRSGKTWNFNSGLGWSIRRPCASYNEKTS